MSRWTSSRPATFNIAGGYSTTDGWLAEVKLGDSNFLGTGKAVNFPFSYGQYARGIDLSASEPYFLGTRVSAGIELYGRQNEASPYQSYGSNIYGATMQLGTPLTEQIGVQYRYSLYNQDVTLDPASLVAAPSLPIQQAALAGPPGFPRSATPSPTTRSTTQRARPAASIRSSGRISPASAAT